MRKVTKQALDAFMNSEKVTVGNTMSTGGAVYLHGNKIIGRDEHGNVYITLSGWNTPTTRERLNGLNEYGYNVSVRTKLGQAYLNGKEWGGELTKVEKVA